MKSPHLTEEGKKKKKTQSIKICCFKALEGDAGAEQGLLNSRRQEVLSGTLGWLETSHPVRDRGGEEFGGLRKKGRTGTRRRKDPSPPTSHGVPALTSAGLSTPREPGSFAFPQALPGLCELTLAGRGRCWIHTGYL